MQQPEEEALQSAVGDHMERFDLVGGSAAHDLQIPVQSIGLGLNELDLQGQHDLLFDFFAVGVMGFTELPVQNF